MQISALFCLCGLFRLACLYNNQNLQCYPVSLSACHACLTQYVVRIVGHKKCNILTSTNSSCISHAVGPPHRKYEMRLKNSIGPTATCVPNCSHLQCGGRLFYQGPFIQTLFSQAERVALFCLTFNGRWIACQSYIWPGINTCAPLYDARHVLQIW